MKRLTAIIICHKVNKNTKYICDQKSYKDYYLHQALSRYKISQYTVSMCNRFRKNASLLRKGAVALGKYIDKRGVDKGYSCHWEIEKVYKWEVVQEDLSLEPLNQSTEHSIYFITNHVTDASTVKWLHQERVGFILCTYDTNQCGHFYRIQAYLQHRQWSLWIQISGSDTKYIYIIHTYVYVEAKVNLLMHSLQWNWV